MTKREVEEYIMSQIFPNASHEVTAQDVRNAFAPIVERVWTYLEGRIGDLSQLQTRDKASVVEAINAVLSKLDHDITLTKQEIATLGLKVGELEDEIGGDKKRVYTYTGSGYNKEIGRQSVKTGVKYKISFDLQSPLTLPYYVYIKRDDGSSILSNSIKAGYTNFTYNYTPNADEVIVFSYGVNASAGDVMATVAVTWTVTGGVVKEAPEDGNQYVRKNRQWVKTEPIEVDTTLSKSGMASDAKATGNAIIEIGKKIYNNKIDISRTSCGGFIVPSGDSRNPFSKGMWLKAATYNMSLTLVDLYAGKEVYIVPGGSKCDVAFLKDNVFTDQELPNYCIGEDVKSIAEAGEIVQLPVDCRYIAITNVWGGNNQNNDVFVAPQSDRVSQSISGSIDFVPYRYSEFMSLGYGVVGSGRQGSANYGKYFVQCYNNTDKMTLFDLEQKIRIQDFTVNGMTNPRTHANSATFGNKYEDTDEFPLLYVCSGYSATSKTTDYQVYAVRITSNGGVYSGNVVQTINFDFGIANSWNETVVDVDKNRMWTKMAKKWYCYELPDPHNGDIIITPETPVIDSFMLPEPEYIANSSNQGHLYYKGKIIYTSGYPSQGVDSLYLAIINTHTKCRESIIWFGDMGITDEEPEGVFIWNDELYVPFQTNIKKIYR